MLNNKEMEKKDLEEITPKGAESDISDGNDMVEGESKIKGIPLSSMSASNNDDSDNSKEDEKDDESSMSSQSRSLNIHSNMDGDSPNIPPFEKITNMNSHRIGLDNEIPLIPSEVGNVGRAILKSGIPDRMSERMRDPIYNTDDLEEEFDLNKRMAFGLNKTRRNVFFHCYR